MIKTKCWYGDVFIDLSKIYTATVERYEAVDISSTDERTKKSEKTMVEINIWDKRIRLFGEDADLFIEEFNQYTEAFDNGLVL